MSEHLARARLFSADSLSAADPPRRLRYAMAAIYSARAVVELMLESADRDEVATARGEVESAISGMLPNYHLIEALRIHDFHRFGLRYEGVAVLGPVKLGGGTVRHQRTLYKDRDQVRMAETDAWVPISTAADEFISALPAALERFDGIARELEQG